MLKKRNSKLKTISSTHKKLECSQISKFLRFKMIWTLPYRKIMSGKMLYGKIVLSFRFWSKILILDQNLNFGQNSDCIQNFYFCQIFRSFWYNFYFSPKFRLCDKIFKQFEIRRKKSGILKLFENLFLHIFWDRALIKLLTTKILQLP